MNSFDFERNSFLTQMDTELPNLCSRWRVTEESNNGDYYNLKFKTKKPYPIAKVIEMFEDDANLNILYHRVVSDGLHGWQCACAFSHPIGTKMYKFNVCTGDDGIVDEVSVTIFNSIEIYGATLRVEFDEHKKSGGMKIEMDQSELIKMMLK